MKLRALAVAAGIVAVATAVPQVRRGLSRLLLLTTGTVVRDQRRIR